ncbi:MAG: hypothetical protein ACPGID_00865 [Rubricella sp.]
MKLLRSALLGLALVAHTANAQEPSQRETETFITNAYLDRPDRPHLTGQSAELRFDGSALTAVEQEADSGTGFRNTWTRTVDLGDIGAIELRTREAESTLRGCVPSYVRLVCAEGSCVTDHQRGNWGRMSNAPDLSGRDFDTRSERSVFDLAQACDQQTIRRVGNALRHLGAIHGLDIPVLDELYDEEAVGSAFD